MNAPDNRTELLPLKLTAFEQLMLADDQASYPMTFFIEIAVSGNLKKTEFESAFQSAISRHPLLVAVIRRSRLAQRWVPAASPPKVSWNIEFPSPTAQQRSLDLKKIRG